jgi:multiple sugar transport system ATP-binding protein
MRAGIIQQVDTPKELYDNPLNLFVAGFIGSPSMNFLPARLEGDTITLPFGDAPLPDRLKSRMRRDANARDVIAGIRPEHFEDAEVAGANAPGLRFRTRVSVVESMGSELFVHFDVAGGAAESAELAELAQDAGMEDLPSHGGDETQVVARLDAASRAAPGEEIELVLETGEIKLFDPDGGRSLTVAEPVAA